MTRVTPAETSFTIDRWRFSSGKLDSLSIQEFAGDRKGTVTVSLLRHLVYFSEEKFFQSVYFCFIVEKLLHGTAIILLSGLVKYRAQRTTAAVD